MMLRRVADLYAGAVRDMATLPGTVQVRLIHACRRHLSHVGWDQADIPDALWDVHVGVCLQVTAAIPDGTPNPFEVRFSMMSDGEAADMARRIADLADRLRAACQAPPWHYVGEPTAVIRVLSEPRGSAPSIRDPGVN
jgi:hypothetical protein